MIPKDKIQKICSEYGTGEHVSLDKIDQGVLNDNYLLETSTGKYFIKSVRQKARDSLQMIYGVESFMKLNGIPAVAMLKTKSGDIFLVDEDQVYTVYPFVESEKISNYSGDDYQRMGEMLGKIHLVGSRDLSDIPNLKNFKRQSDEVILTRLQNYKEELTSKKVKDGTDNQFLEYIDFKLGVYSKIKPSELPSDTLIHGDYHPENLLFDKNTREIIGVCDWEKTEFAPRAYELARSIFYSCLQDEEDFEDGLDNAKAFLTGYLSVYPMSQDEVMEGINMRIHRMALSSWIEEKYYKGGDSRANKFINNEMRLLDKMVNGRGLDQIKSLLNYYGNKN